MKQTSSSAQAQAQAPSGAQGTIEYLVIIAVVVVIGLVVVGLLMGMTGSGAGLSSNSSKINSKVGSGGLSISGVVIDSNGDGIFKVSNISGEVITLTKVATGGLENTFSQTVPIGGNVDLGVNSLDLKCPCVAGQTKVSCDYNFIYTSSNGFSKVVPVTVQADCVSDSTTTAPLIVPVMTVTGSDCWVNTSINPNPICTLSDLNRMREHLDWNYILEADINAAATRTWADVNGFLPIGNSSTNFSGTFNGNNHYISSLFIYRPSTSNVGLFGYASGTARILNVGLRDVNIRGTDSVGALVGYIWAGSTVNSIVNCYVTGNVAGSNISVGGLVGYKSGGASILNCYSTANVISTSESVGGLVGGSSGGTITNSYATGNITGGWWNIGGLIGSNSSTTIYSSYATGDVTGRVTGASYAGGLAGGGGSIFNSYATGRVTATTYVGGLSGSSSIFSSYATGDVNGTTYVGGLVGDTYSSLRNSFSLGNVDGNSYVGGLVGRATSAVASDINNNYSISRVNGLFVPMNGFLGKSNNASVVNNAYWNPTLATKSNCYRNNLDVDGNTGCTAGVYVASDFYASGIPFTVLGFDGNWLPRSGGYPKLAWQTN